MAIKYGKNLRITVLKKVHDEVHKTKERARPLGNIPTKELKNARQHIHKILDPLWKNKIMPRGKVYAIISEKLGYQYHTAEIRTVEEARKIYAIVKAIAV